MSESEIIKVEYEAIKQFCRGDKRLALKITSELGGIMRSYIEYRFPERVTVNELLHILECAAEDWKN